METQLPKQVYFQNEDCKVAYQIYEDVVNIHCEMYKTTPRTIRNGYKIFVEMQKYFKEQGYKALITITPNPKFVKMYGGVFVSTVVYDEKEYEVFKWELN